MASSSKPVLNVCIPDVRSVMKTVRSEAPLRGIQERIPRRLESIETPTQNPTRYPVLDLLRIYGAVIRYLTRYLKRFQTPAKERPIPSRLRRRMAKYHHDTTSYRIGAGRSPCGLYVKISYRLAEKPQLIRTALQRTRCVGQEQWMRLWRTTMVSDTGSGLELLTISSSSKNLKPSRR
jgi:hypothetical protein